MSELDNRLHIREFDPSNYLSHILDTPEQLQNGFALGESIHLPAVYVQAKHLVIIAVGELIPVAYAIQALALKQASIPVIVVDDYTLPHWVSRDTCVMAIDYNGESEQVVDAFRQAGSKQAKLIAVSTGGELAKIARRYKSPHIALDYGAVPRATFTYILSALTYVLKKLGVVDFSAQSIEATVKLATALLSNISVDVELYRNAAKQLAEKVAARQTVIISSSIFWSVAKKWQVDFAATGKVVTQASTLAEFNDTIINGIDYQSQPATAPVVIMLQSHYDESRNKLQQTMTYQVAQAQKFIYEQVFIHPSESLFSEIILASLFGSMVSYYLAWLRNRDPSTTEATDFIHEHLLLATNNG